MSRLTGVSSVRRAIRALPSALKVEAVQALRTVVSETRDTGRANIDSAFRRHSGDLRRNYRSSVSVKALTGRVGYLTPKARRAAFYARFLHDGTVDIEGIPFHDRAIDVNEERFFTQCGQALRDALSGYAAPSGGRRERVGR